MGGQVILVGLVAILLGSCSTGLSPGGPWSDESGVEQGTDVLWAWIGDEGHCGWGSATNLWIDPRAAVPGIDESMYDQYIRDPEGLFEDRLAAEFISGVNVPDDAAYTGYSTSRLKLWVAPGVASAVFIETDGDRFEQWPRVEGEDPIQCA